MVIGIYVYVCVRVCILMRVRLCTCKCICILAFFLNTFFWYYDFFKKSESLNFTTHYAELQRASRDFRLPPLFK